MSKIGTKFLKNENWDFWHFCQVRGTLSHLLFQIEFWIRYLFNVHVSGNSNLQQYSLIEPKLGIQTCFCQFPDFGVFLSPILARNYLLFLQKCQLDTGIRRCWVIETIACEQTGQILYKMLWVPSLFCLCPTWAGVYPIHVGRQLWALQALQQRNTVWTSVKVYLQNDPTNRSWFENQNLNHLHCLKDLFEWKWKSSVVISEITESVKIKAA